MPAGRPKNKREVTPRLRWALDKAIDILETESGLDLAQHIAKDMEERGLASVIRDYSCILPKDVAIDHTKTVNVSVNTNQIADEVLKQVLVNDEPTPKELH